MVMLSPGRQADLVLRSSGLATDQVGADVSQQAGHHCVVVRDQRDEAADAFLTATVR